MKFLRKILKFFAWFFGIITLLIIVFCIYVWRVSDVEDPKIAHAQTDTASIKRVVVDSTCTTIGNNWIRKNKYGLYEMYVEGDGFRRGVINGKLSQSLIIAQEEAFVKQIREMIPSQGYLKFLRYITGFMNRDLPEYVTDEYKQEIYGISLSASDSFNWIGSNYARQLNYHAAHDIGHALQNMMLVGCTSFSAWDGKTDKGEMLIGRNFDFWVGDDFAKNKIVEFVHPTEGHNFAFVTWGGFIGVVSGMNDKGLTVTINAAKSKIPTGAATPVSLVAREVLQYAANINEAIAITKKRKMFVSESFLIGSASDHKSVIIEKTPEQLAIYDAASDNITCTNHYQSNLFKNDELNIEQKESSASVYRYERMQELLQTYYPLNPIKMAAILRDYKGMGNTDIGIGNEKAVNQMIAHHSIIFMPDSLRMWVSTSPWQLGTYVCYDLNTIFAMNRITQDKEIANEALNIPADTFLNTTTFANFLQFRRMKWDEMQHKAINPELMIQLNPNYYDAYRIAGDYYANNNNINKAINCYKLALTKEIATQQEKISIERKIEKLEKNRASR